MDFDKLDEEVKRILSQEGGPRAYSEIRQQLVEMGYNQEEMKYILGLVDDQLLIKLDKGGENKVAQRNMVIGAVLAVIGLLVIGASYFGNQAPKEIYYVSLVVFAVGYLVFRNGFRRRKGNGGNNRTMGTSE
jgi:hypothetical protein